MTSMNYVNKVRLDIILMCTDVEFSKLTADTVILRLL